MPGRQLGQRKRAGIAVDVARVSLVASLIAVTAAPATTAPDASSTRPRMTPRWLCASSPQRTSNENIDTTAHASLGIIEYPLVSILFGRDVFK